MSREKRTKAEWTELLSRQATSGQGVKEWCNGNEINVNTMYNKITKNRKEQARSEIMQKSEFKEPSDTKTKKIEAKPVSVEWKEIKIFPEQQRDAIQKGSVYVEIGSIRMAADAGYPVVNLAALCKELIKPC